MEESSEIPSVGSLPGMSLGVRLMNIYAAPSDVFDDIKRRPVAASNWVVPLVLVILVSIVAAFIVASQPAIQEAVLETQEKMIQKQVASGRITQKQADSEVALIQKYLKVGLEATGVFGSIIGGAMDLFVGALVVWILARTAFRSDVLYQRMVELIGLSLMVSALGVVVGMLLTVIFGNSGAGASPALLLSHYDLNNPAHRTLAALNVFTLWRLALVSLGLNRLCGAKFTIAAAWIFGLWAVLTLLTLGPVLILSGSR